MWQQRAIPCLFGIATVFLFFPAAAAAELLRCDQCSEAQRLAQLPAPLRVPQRYLFADFSNGQVHGYLVPARPAAGEAEQASVTPVSDIPEPLRAMASHLSQLYDESHGSLRIEIPVRAEDLGIPSVVVLIGHEIPDDWPTRARIQDALRERGETLLTRDPALQAALAIWRSQDGLHSTFPGWLDDVHLDFRVRFADGAEHVFRRDWESDVVRMLEQETAPSPADSP